MNEENLIKQWLRAASELLSICVLGATILGAGLVSVWLLPLGLLAWLLIVYNNFKQAGSAVYEIRPLEKSSNLLKARGQYLVMAGTIERAGQKILDSIAKSSPSVKEMMRQSLPKIHGLVDRCRTLLSVLVEINEYLAEVNIHKLEGSLKSLDRNIEAAKDDLVRSNLSRTRESVDERIRSLRTLDLGRERIISQVESMLAALETMYSQVLRLRTSEGRQANFEYDQISSTLDTLTTEMSTLAETVDEVYGRVRPLSQ